MAKKSLLTVFSVFRDERLKEISEILSIKTFDSNMWEKNETRILNLPLSN